MGVMVDTQKLLAQLNAKQCLAASHTVGPALVLAGAGSGKTRVLTVRVALLLAQGLAQADNILLVTFTNKAALEMKQRVAALVDINLPMAGTFHALATKILRRFAPGILLSHNFTIYDSDDQLALLKTLYKRYGWDKKTYSPLAVKAAISQAKNQLLSPLQYAVTAYGAFGEFVSNAYKLYQEALWQEQALDFDDLLNYALKLLEKDAYARRTLQQQLKFVLIDEYQDTNTAQYRLSQILSAPENNLFVVGDFSQSIYAWRGANYKNMLSLQNDYPDLTTYHLDQNYRSTQSILTAATQVISKNTDHPILNLWTENKSRQLLTVFDCETGELEARAVAQEIQTLSSTYNYSQMAILYRTNAQSRSFEEALSRLAIPYQLIGGFKFYERKEIKDALCYLRLVVNPHESVSLQRALKIGKRRYGKFTEFREKLLANPDTNPGTLPPAEILVKILEITDYQKLYDQSEPEDAAKLENIAELLAYAKQFSTLNRFLENIALVQDGTDLDGKKNQDNKRDGVFLMSLHSAKGLEFEVVFLVGMEDNLFPHARSFFDPEQLAEERRLCYVGITRAKEKLYFSHARKRWSYSGINNACRSCFLDDLNPDLLEVKFLQTSGDDYRRHFFSTENQPPRFYPKSKITPPIQERHLDLSDSQLDEFLSGDLDAKEFLRR